MPVIALDRDRNDGLQCDSRLEKQQASDLPRAECIIPSILTAKIRVSGLQFRLPRGMFTGMIAKWLVPILLIAFASTAEAGVIVQTHFLQFGEPAVTEAAGVLVSLDDDTDSKGDYWGADRTSDENPWSVEGHPGFSAGPYAALFDAAFACMPPIADRLSLWDGRRPPLPELDGLIKPPQA